MRLCKTCKHWAKPESDYGEIPGIGICQAVPQFWDASQWNKDYDARTLKNEYKNKLAFVQDYSDYFALLKTMPDFGCVQHEHMTNCKL